jgi:ribosomal protein L11 methyltransferase
MADSIYFSEILIPKEWNSDDVAYLLGELEHEGLEIEEEAIRIYFKDTQKDNIFKFIEAYTLSISLPQLLASKNWNETWEKQFNPIYIENEIVIKADFHYDTKPCKHTIIINPKMSFGTGHHPTTLMMLKNMLLVDLSQKSVFDCGSGTGILAIGAEKLGATHIIALDYDEWCYTNALENVADNNCTQITVLNGDIADITEKFDVIFANIHRTYILEHFEDFVARLNQNGLLFVSGFYMDDAKLILDKALTYNCIAQHLTEQENWCSIVFKLN